MLTRYDHNAAEFQASHLHGKWEMPTLNLCVIAENVNYLPLTQIKVIFKTLSSWSSRLSRYIYITIIQRLNLTGYEVVKKTTSFYFANAIVTLIFLIKTDMKMKSSLEVIVNVMQNLQKS